MAYPDYVDHVLDLLAGVGPVRARPMMGGHVVFCGVLPIALVADDRLYLKTDPTTRPTFEAAGCEAFTYESRARVVQMSYWTPPDSALDDPESMLPWARLALEAATRSRRTRAPRRRSGRRRRTARR